MIDSLAPDGSEQSSVELFPFFLANGIRPVVVCQRREEKGVESAVRQLGCEVRILPGTGRIARVRALRGVLEREPVDLIHTTLFESDIAGRLAAMGTGVAVLTSLVNTGYEPVRLKDPNVGHMGLWAARTLDGWTARHLTSHFHAVSQAAKRSAIRALRIRGDRVTVIERGRCAKRLGEPSPERRRAARTRLGLGDDDEVIVNVGRQEYQKGQEYLLQAAGILARTRPHLVVLIAGREGHRSCELAKMCERLQVADRVRFLGHRNDVPEVLASADVFAFPSVYEGMPGAVIEAMALGLPIVASDIPALRELVEDGANGFLVDPASPIALAAALTRILDNPVLAVALGARSIEIFRGRFTIERSAARMIDLYYRIVGEPRGKRRVAMYGR